MEDVGIYTQDIHNPTIVSPFSPYQISLYMTRDSSMDAELYERFISNAVRQFRHTRFYTQYKGFLYELGLDRCQVHGNITSEMASIEMHHNMLTVFDVALIIAEHVINTVGYITTFDLINLLKKAHAEHKVQLVMLSKTPHQIYHDNPEFYIHPSMCFGDWVSFIHEYKLGITQGIAMKLLYYITDALDKEGTETGELLALRDEIADWSGINNVQHDFVPY